MRLSDLKAGSGEKQTLLLPVTSPYPVEMTVICGCRPGKTLVVTAGVHGCEYVGIETLNQLKKELNPAALSGRVILLPLLPWQQADHPGRRAELKSDVSRQIRWHLFQPACQSAGRNPVPRSGFPDGPARRRCQRSTDSADFLSYCS